MVVVTPMHAVINALAKHEECVSELYQQYALRFPEMEGFWTLLAAEEMSHADVVQYLLQKIEEGAAHSTAHHLKLDVIRRSCDYIQEEIHRAKNTPITRINALSIALSLEQAIIERKFFEAFAEDSAEVAQILATLREGATEHLRRVEATWFEHRKK